jgi:uncharacterized protein YndB with AHSA1/START domain
MLDDQTIGLSLEPDRASRHSIGIHASPAEVYRALTEAAELERWFVSRAVIDLRPGGTFRWEYGRGGADPGAAPLVTQGTFREVVKQELLRLDLPIEELETEVEIRIDAWRDGSVVTLTHAGFPGDEEWDETFRAIDRGWQTELHVLKIFLERGRGMQRSTARHARRIKATAEEVFDSFGTKAGLESWLADHAALDATPGGELLLEWTGREAVRGHIAVSDPDRFLLMTWEGDRPSLVRVHIDGDGEGEPVEVTLDHIVFSPAGGTDPGHDWEQALDRLAAHVRLGRTA